jgi:hypothetical protein
VVPAECVGHQPGNQPATRGAGPDT